MTLFLLVKMHKIDKSIDKRNFLRRVKTLSLRIYPQYMRKSPRIQQEHLGYIPRIAETSKISNPGYKRRENEER